MGTTTSGNSNSRDIIERSKIVQQISQGLFDGNEDALYGAIQRRAKVVETLKAQDMQPGDIVSFNATARPKYLQKDVVAEVKEVYATGVLLVMPDYIEGDSGGRFEGREVRCPASIIDKVMI